MGVLEQLRKVKGLTGWFTDCKNYTGVKRYEHKRAKQEIKNTIQVYLTKNAHGEYEILSMRQRPVLLIGPPGIGKTQGSWSRWRRECGIGLVSYTITHRTRQSAIGLPFISEKTLQWEECPVTELYHE